jgi:peptidoglycan/LPS O-acetylase OafA/YrhL
MQVSRYWKALVAAAAAGAGALVTAMGDDTVTMAEGITVAVAVLGALGATYAVPNKEPSAPR